MTQVKKIILAFSLFFYTLYASSEGQLMVMPIRTEVIGLNASTLRLSNQGDGPLFLKLQLYRIENPGGKPEVKTEIGSVKNPEIIVNVSKVTLGPGQSKEISIVPLRKPLSESVYRIYVIPVSGVRFNENENEDSIEAPFTFSIGYGVVVHHYPEKSAQLSRLNYICYGNGIMLQAQGNVHNKIKITMTGDSYNGYEFNLYPSIDRYIDSKKVKGFNNGQGFEIFCK